MAPWVSALHSQPCATPCYHAHPGAHRIVWLKSKRLPPELSQRTGYSKSYSAQMKRRILDILIPAYWSKVKTQQSAAYRFNLTKPSWLLTKNQQYLHPRASFTARYVSLSHHRRLRVGICKTSQRCLQEWHLPVVCCAQKLRRPAAGPAKKKKRLRLEAVHSAGI